MGKSVLPVGFSHVSFRLPTAIVAEIDALAEQTAGVNVFRPPSRSDILREAIDRYLRKERRR